MHIILMSNRLATAKTLNITPRLVVVLVASLFFLTASPFLLFSLFGKYSELPIQIEGNEVVVSGRQVQPRTTEAYVRDNISLMAVKLGEMQAQVMRLESLGERISKLTGVSIPKNEAGNKGGQGGPLVNPSLPLSENELKREIDRLAEIVEQRVDTLTALESQLMERRIKTSLLPTIVPIEASRIGSVFGRRIDPIVGVTAMHEGFDFVADPGTRVIASAGGVVQTAEFHPQYGNLIEIDHGNEFTSRYAHLSKINVKLGQIIKRGQEIGASGNTGRSTGPHLHFEVRFKNMPQDPARFLQQGTQLAQFALAEPNAALVPAKLASKPGKSRVAVTLKAPH